VAVDNPKDKSVYWGW